MKPNKKVVRLTESKLKQMIAEAVQETLNEYGETPYGQYMLGRVAARAQGRGDEDKRHQVYNYAEKKMDGRQHMYNNYRQGWEDQYDLKHAQDAENDGDETYLRHLDGSYKKIKSGELSNHKNKMRDRIKNTMASYQ